MQLLIERGCQFTARNNEGFTASDYAYSYAVLLSHHARAQAPTKVSAPGTRYKIPPVCSSKTTRKSDARSLHKPLRGAMNGEGHNPSTCLQLFHPRLETKFMFHECVAGLVRVAQPPPPIVGTMTAMPSRPAKPHCLLPPRHHNLPLHQLVPDHNFISHYPRVAPTPYFRPVLPARSWCRHPRRRLCLAPLSRPPSHYHP